MAADTSLMGEVFGGGLWGSGLGMSDTSDADSTAQRMVGGVSRLAGAQPDAPPVPVPVPKPRPRTAPPAIDPAEAQVRPPFNVMSNVPMAQQTLPKPAPNVFGSGLSVKTTNEAPSNAPQLPMLEQGEEGEQGGAFDLSKLKAFDDTRAELPSEQAPEQAVPQQQQAPPRQPEPPTPPEQQERPVAPGSQIRPTPLGVSPGDPNAIRRGIFGQPLPPGPTADPLQDYGNRLLYERERAARIANNPLAPFINNKMYTDAQSQLMQLDQKAAELQQTMQKQKDLLDTAHAGGMSPETHASLGVRPTEQTILNGWVQDYSKGRFVAAQQLSTSEAGRALMEQHEGDFMPALDQNNQQATSVITRLNSAAQSGQGAYEAELAKMQKEGIDPNRILSNYQPNFTVPDKAQQWGVAGKGMQNTLAKAQQMVSTYNFQQDSRGLGQPIKDEKERQAISDSGMFKSATTQKAIEGVSYERLPNGQITGVLSGGAKINNYGKAGGASNASPEGVKQFREDLGAGEAKGVIDKYKMAKDYSEAALNPKMYTTAAGITVISGELGAIERDLAEKSDAAGNVGLSKMLDAKYGAVGGGFNTIAKEWSEFSGFINRTFTKGAHVDEKTGQVLDGNNKPIENAPRLSQSTIAGIMDIAKFRKDQATANVEERIGQPMFTAGRLGIPLERSGLSKELQNDPGIQAMWEKGRQSYIDDVNKHPWVSRGEDRLMFQQGSNYPGANKTIPPKSSEQVNQTENQKILASPGHEDPPADGRVYAPQTGVTVRTASAQLQFADTPQQRGIASNIVAPDPKAAMQTKITPNAQALLTTIRGSESNGTNANSYNLIVGGTRFQNYDDHPNQVGVVTKNGKSTAAGAYQFTNQTWTETVKQFSPLLDHDGPDGKVSFSPQNQDKAAWLVAQDRYGKKTGGNLEQDLSDPAKHDQIMKALSGTWTSLPGGSEPNNATASRGDALKLYQGGTLGARLARGMGSMLTSPYQAGGKSDIRSEIKSDIKAAIPAAGATIGAVGGTAIGGPIGGVVGGAAGGGAGQAVQNYIMGRDLSKNVGTQAALGGVTGFIPASKPLVGLAARTLGGSIIGGYEASQQPEARPSDILLGAAKTGAAQLVGEAGMGIFTLALGKAANFFSKYNTATQQELKEAAATVAQGKPEPPVSTMPGQPVSSAAKTAHDAAVKDYDTAVEKLENHHIDPEDAAHASRMEQQNATTGEAAIAGPVAKEETAIKKGYEELKSDVAATGVGVPKQTPLTQGPLSMVGNHPDVPKTQFAIDRATQAENNMSAPARNWSEKYQQLFVERSKLLKEARAAAGGAAPDPNKASTLNAIADNVFEHQKAMMTYAMGPQKAPAAIAKLEDLHQRYAMLMKVAPDGDIVKSILKGGKEGAEALMAYSNYAKDDLGAQQAMAAMLRAAKAGGTSGSTGERIAKVASKVVLGTILAKVGMPHMLVGAFASEMPNIFSKWIGQHAAGAPSTFKDFLAQEARKYTAAAASRQQVRAAAGRIAAGATLQ